MPDTDRRGPVVVEPHELFTVDGQAPSGQQRRRLERFAEMCHNFPNRPRFGEERDQPDAAAARWALQWTPLARRAISLSATKRGGGDLPAEMNSRVWSSRNPAAMKSPTPARATSL